MASRIFKRRLERGNKMFAALEAETDRGKACVGDAMLDEIVKEMFIKRLVGRDADVQEMLSIGQPLGSHGVRLKLASLLGWIGPETYNNCSKIRRIRNKMAHFLDVDSFSHEKVRDLVNQLEEPKNWEFSVIRPSGEAQRVNLKRPQDKFLMAVTAAMMRCWASIDGARRQRVGTDAQIVRVPKRLAAFLTDPKIPNAPA